MKRWVLMSVLMAFVAVVLCCAPSTKNRKPEDMILAATALDEKFVAAFNRKDAVAIANLYWNSPDVVSFRPLRTQYWKSKNVASFPAEGIARGREAIRDANIGSFGAWGVDAKLELLESHQIPFGEVVIGYGLWRISGPDPAGYYESVPGKPYQIVGRYMDVKAERDGKWVYIIDEASIPSSIHK